MSNPKSKTKLPKVPKVPKRLEADIKKEIKDLCSRGAVHLQVNAVGAFRNPNGGFYQYGLGPSTPDLVGWKTTEITPEMVGRFIAVYTVVEVKQPGEQPTPKQRDCLQQVADAGGIAIVAHCLEDALEPLQPELFKALTKNRAVR